MDVNSDLLALNSVRRVRPGEEGFIALVQSPTLTVTLESFFDEKAGQIRSQIQEVGAILFRGFAVSSPQEFERSVKVLEGNLNEGYGDLPTTVECCRFVQHATPYPPDRAILFHNEASHTMRWPNYQWFYCRKPAESGGETPLVRCDTVWNQLSAELKSDFEQLGLCYHRCFIPGLDRRWQEFFRTSDPRQVEKHCKNEGVEWLWLDQGHLRISTPRPAILQHQIRGTTSFFNQILLHHPSCLDRATRESLLSLYGEEGLPRNVKFGDGRQIPDSVIAAILELTVKSAVCFEWETGDILMLDNTIVSHARRPFQGQRELLVALSAFISDEEHDARRK
jgi:alpha-ketoglutarate-dependent taurine dioxygenase